MSIVDIATMYTWIYFLQKKSDVARTFVELHSNVERQLVHLLKSVQTNGGGEFKYLSLYLLYHIINHRVTCQYTSEQNRIVERKHIHIVAMGLTLLHQAYLSM